MDEEELKALEKEATAKEAAGLTDDVDDAVEHTGRKGQDAPTLPIMDGDVLSFRKPCIRKRSTTLEGRDVKWSEFVSKEGKILSFKQVARLGNELGLVSTTFDGMIKEFFKLIPNRDDKEKDYVHVRIKKVLKLRGNYGDRNDSYIIFDGKPY